MPNGSLCVQVTVKLLQKAMAESGKLKVLIDGFPRNDDNRKTFESVVRARLPCEICCASAR